MIAAASSPPEGRPHTDAEVLSALPTMEPGQRRAAIESLLRHEDPAMREAAVRAGAMLLSAQAQVEYLRDGEDHVLRNAGLEMLKRRGRQIAPLAAELLRDQDPDVVLAAVLLLDHVRDRRAVHALRRALHHYNQNVVQAAIIALGHVGSAAVIPDLIEFLDADLWLQMAAIVALGDLGCPEALIALLPRLDDALLAPTVVDAIARVGGNGAFTALGSRWIAHGLAETGLLEALAHVVEELPGEPPPMRLLPRALGEALRTLPAHGRLAAARVALATGPGPNDEAALDLVAPALADMEDTPACLARRSDLIGSLLARGGAARGWGLRLATQYPADAPLDALLTAIARLEPGRHVDAAVAALAHARGEGVGAAIVAWYTRLGPQDRVACGPLIRRQAAAVRRALLEPWPESTGGVRAVLATVTEEDPAAAAAAIIALPLDLRVAALAHAEGRAHVVPLLPWLRWLAENPDAFGRFAVTCAELAGLGREREHLRALCARAPHKDLVRLLGRLRDEESVPLLTRIAASGPEGLRPFALAAIGSIGGDAARGALRELARQDGPWARFAWRALAECRVESDMDVFRAAVTHPDWHVRLVVAEVLGRSGETDDRRLLAALAADPMVAVSSRASGELSK